MVELLDEIVIDIISRLPVKSLLRFKCVSKIWCSLTCDAWFTKLHVKRTMEDNDNGSTSNRLLLKTNTFHSIDYEAFVAGENSIDVMMELPYPEMAENFETNGKFRVDVVGSCDGMVCLVDHFDNIIIWNPSTRESKNLSKPSWTTDGGILFYGFGYDGFINDYKVVYGVCFEDCDDSLRMLLHIIELKNSTWRRIHSRPAANCVAGEGMFSNGALHWLETLGEEGLDETYIIESFDLVDEKFQEVMSLPNQFDHKTCYAFLGISENNLFIFYFSQNSVCFQAWMMREYGVKESWSKFVSVPVATYPLDKRYLIPLCFAKDGQVILNLDSRNLVVCDPKKVSFEYLMRQNDYWGMTGVVYVESLVSPNWL